MSGNSDLKKRYKELENLSNDEILRKSLLKKAKGFVLEEIIEEYCKDEENKKMVLSKKKVTTKEVPPDTASIKFLMEIDNLDKNRFSTMTDEELRKEKERLFNLLREESDGSEGI